MRSIAQIFAKIRPIGSMLAIGGFFTLFGLNVGHAEPVQPGSALVTPETVGAGSADHFSQTMGDPNRFVSVAQANEIRRLQAQLEFLKELRLKSEKAPPPKRATREIKTKSGFLNGLLTQLSVSREIYIAARHVFEGIELNESDPLLSDFYIYDVVTSEGKDLDVSILVRKRQNKPLLSEMSAASLLGMGVALKNPQVKDAWAAWQLGSVDVAAVDQVSSGFIARVARDGQRFWLNQGLDNLSSPGSSGSLVWTSTASSKAQRLDWTGAGIVECLQSKDDGTADGVRVIPFSVILKGKLVLRTFEQVGNDQRMSDPRCKPIHRRGGGGE